MRAGEFLAEIGRRIARAPGRAVEDVLLQVALRADEAGAVELPDTVVARLGKCSTKTVQRARAWAVAEGIVEAVVGTGRTSTVWRFVRSIVSAQGGHEGGHHALGARKTMRDTRRKPRVDRGVRRISRVEVDRIRDAVLHHRPEWDARGVCSVIYRLSKQGAGPSRIEAVLCSVARDPNTRTPGQALQPGPWHDEGSAYRTGPAPALAAPKPSKPFLPRFVPTPLPRASRSDVHGDPGDVPMPASRLWDLAGGLEVLRARRPRFA